MQDTVSHHDLIREARREIRALKPGRGIRRDAWFFVRELLLEIAGHIPDCWPSERTLAKKLKRHQQAVHRSLDLAREWGLVTTTPKPMEHAWRPGQTYHLVCLSEPLRAAIARHQFQTTLRVVSKTSSSKKSDTGSPSGIPHCPAAPGTKEVAVGKERFDPRDEFSAPATGADPRGSLGEPTVIESVEPAVYLARRFDAKWARLLRSHPDLRDVRASSRGPTIGYLREVMLLQISPEHAEQYMDAFIQAVADGEIEFRDGQFAFRRFVGWWGTVPLEDPSIKAQKSAFTQAVLDEYHRQYGSS